MDEHQKDGTDGYRKYLLDATLQTNRDFDKAVFALSGGALAISIVFLRDIAPRNPEYTWTIVAAWSLFAASLLATFVSIATAENGLRVAIDEYDAGERPRHPGGKWHTWTNRLNRAAAAGFMLGVVFAFVFAYVNL